MIEMFMKPKRAERRPWEMFFIGLLYSVISLLLVSFVFKGAGIGSYAGWILVLLTTIACLPFVYYIIKLEEGKDVEITEEGTLIKEHSKAIQALMWMFLGFVIGFSLVILIFPTQTASSFNAQVEVFCAINNPSTNAYNDCIAANGVRLTGNVVGLDNFMGIFANNVYVLIFIIVFSLAFGAGAIFILVWNASVIAAAIGMFMNGSWSLLPSGILRYLIHGIPEIVAYFVAALAGGIISVAVIRRDLEGERKYRIFQDALLLVIIAIIILIFAAAVEVFITPLFF